MKKWIIGVVLAGMFGWAVYDMVVERTHTESSGELESTAENRQQADTGLSKGQTAPDFTVQTLSGETVSLTDYRGEKVMLNFWATWCPPCRAEMPDMEKFYRNEDVTVLAVNMTDTESQPSDVSDFVKDFELTFPILMDEDLTISELYQIVPVPTSIFIDAEGRVQSVIRGAMNYDMMLQRYSDL
ncbi:redoxin domain-containing protein [Halobacillus litoralis]|uniref:redoxin domain-containing protein n=1 Tax=Halobacillus litoralis TaxID=45668 RepID=UPI001CD362F5|nr:redoxin domain-containing protein [Halobacillus litoralis]MCA0971289.1 redoxin domain-containing protein [Halobacillus litoralis]